MRISNLFCAQYLEDKNELFKYLKTALSHPRNFCTIFERMSKSLLFLFFLINNPLLTNAQSEIINNDSVKTFLISYRVSGGASVFSLRHPLRNIGVSYDEYYNTEQNAIDGYTTQMGIKLSSTAKERTAFTFELNYCISQYHWRYMMYTGGHAQGSISGDYRSTLHSAQLAVLPRIMIGNKKKFYFCFGPYISVPIYESIKGTKKIVWSYGINSSAQELKDKEIKSALQAEFGGIISVGTNIKLKKNNILSIELRYQPCLINSNKEINTFINSVVISAMYTLGKPIYYTFWTN